MKEKACISNIIWNKEGYWNLEVLIPAFRINEYSNEQCHIFEKKYAKNLTGQCNHIILTFLNVFLKRNLFDDKIGLVRVPREWLIEFSFQFVISHGGRRTDYELNLMNVSHVYEWNASKERTFEVNSEWAGEILIVSSILVYDVTGVGTRP